MKNKNNYTLLIIVCVILLSILGILYFDGDESESIINNNETKYLLLDDYSRFYTVESIVYKYINLITSNNVSDLINVLDEDYVSNNNITSETVFNYVDKLEGLYSFKAKKIYYENNGKYIIKYYVYGILNKEGMDEIIDKSDYYLVVNIDTKNNLFSITPYDGKIFKEVNNG